MEAEHSPDVIIEATERFHALLEDNKYLVLATESDTKPWIAPLFYAFDKNNNLYFISRHESYHAQHVRNNSSVAVAIFNSTSIPGQCDGIQLSGTARELTSISDVTHAAKILFTRRFTDTESRKQYLDPKLFMKLSEFRLYEIVPAEAYVVDTSRPNDYRIKVNLET